MQSIVDRNRPRTLSDLFGQGAARFALESFLEAPYSCGFLFEGPTGIGKTSAAHALARDLGVSIEDGPFGGWYVVASGDQTADAVRETLRMIRVTPMGSREGWRVVLIDEADRMSPAVKHLWLSGLEDLPTRTVVVFTTNDGAKLEQRFRDRCEVLQFVSNAAALMQDAMTLARTVWERETGSAEGCPDISAHPGIADESGNISFRRAVMALAAPLRVAPKRQPEPEKPRAVRRDLNGATLKPFDRPVPVPVAAPIAEQPAFALSAPRPAPSLFGASTGFVTVGSAPAPKLPTSGGRGATLAPMTLSASIRDRHKRA